jgi:hypothetical protein
MEKTRAIKTGERKRRKRGEKKGNKSITIRRNMRT